MYTNPKYNPDMNSRHSQEAARMAEQATELFRETLKNPVDVVPLSDFRRVMLPMLAEIAHGREFDLDGWFAIVSHPSVELSVVDDTTGEEVYRISSVWQQTDISCKDPDMIGISAYMDGLQMMKSTDMIAAHDRLMELAEERIDYTTPEQIIDDAIVTINRLNKVFADHQLPTLPDPEGLRGMYQRTSNGEDPAVVASTEAAPVEPVESTEREYDEL